MNNDDLYDPKKPWLPVGVFLDAMKEFRRTCKECKKVCDHDLQTKDNPHPGLCEACQRLLYLGAMLKIGRGNE